MFYIVVFTILFFADPSVRRFDVHSIFWLPLCDIAEGKGLGGGGSGGNIFRQLPSCLGFGRGCVPQLQDREGGGFPPSAPNGQGT